MRHRPVGHIPARAILMIVGAVACFAMSDTIVKWLAGRQPISLVVWARWATQVLAMLVWLAPGMGLRMVHTRQLRMQLVRGALLIAASFLFMAALAYMPLANATALGYLTPTLVIVLAVRLLGERLTRLRIAFVAAGLVGMLMIVQPGADIFQGASLLVLCSAACNAAYQVATRMLAAEDPRVTLFYPALVGAAIMTLVWHWFGARIDVAWVDVASMIAVGLLGTAGHFLLILAFQRGPASGLTPFTYVHLVFATMLGWLVFGDLPDALTFSGMALIAGSGLLLTWRERRRTTAGGAEPTAID